MNPVRVRFDVRDPTTHLVRVTLSVPASKAPERTFRMPAWVPGSYKIRDFGRHVQDLEAKAGGRKAEVRHPSKDAWVVGGTARKPVEVAYSVYSRELTVDTSHVTADHAHLFPATLVMYDEASRPLPHKATVTMPRGWTLWSPLETGRLDGTLAVAEGYDNLIDSPIECGPPRDYAVRRFRAAGRTHRHVVWNPPADADWRRLDRDMAAIVRETVKVWGEAPYPHYTFLTHVAEGHGGGLEHRGGTVLGADPLHLVSDEKIQARFLPLVAHEFFHTWNVKRILPAAFQPYDLQAESYTDLLWLFEGFTSYYELPILHRAKVVDGEAWGKVVGEDLESYQKQLGRRRISVAEASRLTWTLLYQPHEQNVNRNVSYYTKGMWVGLCLDAELRRRGVREGLDAVMRHLWRKHGRTAMGLTDDGFPDVVEQATGHNLRTKLRAWTEGTEELPIDASLRTLGWTVKREWKEPKKRLGLGIEFKPGTTSIARIPENSPSSHVLQPDDDLVAVAGYRWKGESFPDRVAHLKPGTDVEVGVFREGRLRVLKVPLMEMPKDKITVKIRKGNATATRRRRAWLGLGKIAPKRGRRHRTD
ncbi:MAG TPA: hypothetical protein VI796_03990 [Candidatus Thermoplasmatota archaeon]|nr:hypothetical protein [Candidatus Thermoplasmatota archaeon]